MLLYNMTDTVEAPLIPIHMAPVDVADKLIKIMSLVRGSTDEHEIQAAIAKAQALAIKNRIDLATIVIDDAGVSSGDTSSNDPITQIRFQTCAGKCRRPPADKWISTLILQYFNVRMVNSGSTMWVIGRTSDALFAEYIYFFLKSRFSALWVKHKQEYDSQMYQRNSFYAGLHSGLSSKLHTAKAEAEKEALLSIVDHDKRELVTQKYTMTLVTETEKLKQAALDYHPHMTACKTSFDDNVNHYGMEFREGVKEGSKIDISRPLGDPSKKIKPEILKS